MSTGDLNREPAKSTTGSKVIQFLFCFGLAIIFWLFTSLSSEHQDTIDVDLHYSIAEDKISTLKLPSVAELDVKARGWELLREIFLTRSLSVDLADFSSGHLLLTNSRADLFEKELPDSYHILHISPDTLHVFFDDKVTKKVPVLFIFKLPLPQAEAIDSVCLQPDSIEISGARSVVEPIQCWTTETVRVSEPDTVLQGIAVLTNPADQNIRLSAIAVSYEAALSFMTRYSFNTRVIQRSYNQSIKVSYCVPLSSQSYHLAYQFSFGVQDDSIHHCKKIVCTEFPADVQNIQIEPALIKE